MKTIRAQFDNLIFSVLVCHFQNIQTIMSYEDSNLKSDWDKYFSFL